MTAITPQDIWNALQPYLPLLLAEAAKESGRELPAAVSKLWTALTVRMARKPAAKEALDDLRATPEDGDAQAAFRQQVKKMLSRDPAFAAELAPLLQAVRVDTHYHAEQHGDGAIAQNGSTAVGAGAAYVGRSVNTGGGAAVMGSVETGGDFTGRDAWSIKGEGNVQAQEGAMVVIAKEGARVVIGAEAIPTPAVRHNEALRQYLRHVIAGNRYLELRGIRSGGRVVNIQLDEIYISLKAVRKRAARPEEDWLRTQEKFAPGEQRKRAEETADALRVEKALAAHRHLVVLGDPGSGKTTLLRYLALLYARDMATSGKETLKRLGVQEAGSLPVLLPLRRVGAFLAARRPREDGTEGHALLLDFLYEMLRNEKIELPAGFFEAYLRQGKAVILLDGLDEVADPNLRRRVSEMVDAFARAYAGCRFVVTSRIVGYIDTVKLGGEFAVATVKDFSLDDIRAFLTNWHRAIAVGMMGATEAAFRFAEAQTRQLLDAIQSNNRILELAINPLMLTVIALVHRDRVKLPDRRAELYAEAVEVLLGKRDEARGVRELPILQDRPFDTGDKRLLLQEIALAMHERERKELDVEDLRRMVSEHFAEILAGQGGVRRATERFLQNVAERSGLLMARGEGVYAFSHLTFQEYLAAVEIAGRDDYVAYTLARSGQEWWREVVLLEAGYLSTQSKARTTRLIRTLAERKEEPEPYYNLVLAAECVRDVGENRVEGALYRQIVAQLQEELDTALAQKTFWGNARMLLTRGMTAEAAIARRIAAANALGKLGGARYWKLPYGEPEWVEIPAGTFLMGSDPDKDRYVDGDEQPQHTVDLPTFFISRTPITNAQYALFLRDSGYRVPGDWEGNRPPRGKEIQPVVKVAWYDALAYCRWLGEKIGKPVALPSEAEWEKAARGVDGRTYPWGNAFDAIRCNTSELGLGGTTPVGIFPQGASPYGVLDLSGNVWEWTRSLYGEYPYDPADGRENLDAPRNERRVLRGGSFDDSHRNVRCAARVRYFPNLRLGVNGFRVVLSPSKAG